MTAATTAAVRRFAVSVAAFAIGLVLLLGPGATKARADGGFCPVIKSYCYVAQGCPGGCVGKDCNGQGNCGNDPGRDCYICA